MDWQNSGDNNPYNNNPYHNPYSGRPCYPASPSGDRLATASMVLGILTIMSVITMTIYPAMILGSISITLALLSKGRAPRLFQRAIAGVICATLGLLLNIALVGSSLYLFLTVPAIRDQVETVFEQTYGMSMDEFYKMLQEDSTAYDSNDDIDNPAGSVPENNGGTTYLIPDENAAPDYDFFDL